jgi:protein-S-isoprenylcysteine O-methyltransferase Ste14
MRQIATRVQQPAFEGRERLLWLLSTAALASVFLIFALAHFQRWIETGHFSGLGVVAQETLIVVLFIVRRRASKTTRSPVAWIATAIGAFGVLALRPAGEAAWALGGWWAGLQLVAAVGYTGSLGFLGRSFGVVPAYRGLRTGGPYRWVRHPAYASYLVGNLGYLLENPTWWNATVLAAAIAAQFVRIHHEEAVLSEDPAYVAYRERTRWRLIPFVY